MSPDEIIAYIRQCRAGRKESTYASDRVHVLLDLYDERGREAIEVIEKLSRLMLPLVMTMAEAELVDEPIGDDAMVLHFMGSGASDTVTAGQVRSALALATAFRIKHDNPTEEGTDDDQRTIHAGSGDEPQSLSEP